MKLNRIKLAKLLLKFGEVKTTDGITISYEGDFENGLELFVEINGELKPIEDGKHILEDGRIIETENGVIMSITKNEEPKEEPVEDAVKEVFEEPIQELVEEIVEETVDNDKIKELEDLIKEKDKIIAELMAKVKEYEEKLSLSVQKPAKDAIKLQQIKALKYFIN